MVMRVLLIGEASGVHRNLKRGLTRLGIECRFLTHTTAFPWEENDDVFAPRSRGMAGGFVRNLAPLLKIARLERYDVISFAQSLSTILGRFTRYADLPLLRRKARVLSYYATGCDELGIIRRNPDLPYRPCTSCLASGDAYSRGCEVERNPIYEQSMDRARRLFDFGASSMVEYGHVEPLFPLFRRIPLPVDSGDIAFTPARDRPRPSIVHTPTRRGFKGTATVLEAIERLRRARDDFEFQVVEGLSYPEYLERMRNADIVIDQVYSQSPGMNALEMMAAGKVVMTGATELGLAYHGFTEPGPFDASPDPGQLAAGLGRLLDRKAELPELGATGRRFVERYHSPETIARKFVEGWEAAIQQREMTAA